MTEQEIPIDVAAFLSAYVESYEQLETLLLLQAERSQAWTSSSIAKKLGISEADARESLELLHAQGMVRVEGDQNTKFSYAPASSELEDVIARLATLYTERRLEIMKLMSANAIARVRDAAIRTFSDAFLLSGKKKDG